jgi:hypothetical protein
MPTHSKRNVDADRAWKVERWSEEVEAALQENRLVRILHLFPLFFSLSLKFLCLLVFFLPAVNLYWHFWPSRLVVARERRRGSGVATRATAIREGVIP